MINIFTKVYSVYKLYAFRPFPSHWKYARKKWIFFFWNFMAKIVWYESREIGLGLYISDKLQQAKLCYITVISLIFKKWAKIQNHVL